MRVEAHPPSPLPYQLHAPRTACLTACLTALPHHLTSPLPRLHGGALLHRWTAGWLQRTCEAREGEPGEPTPAAEPMVTVMVPEAERGEGEGGEGGEAEGGEGGEAEGGALRSGLEVACECAAQRLLAVGFAMSASLHLCELRCEADGSHVQISPLPALTLALPAPAIAAETTAAGSLCVLLPGEVIIFPPSASRGFDRAQAVRVPLGSHEPPEPEPAK